MRLNIIQSLNPVRLDKLKSVLVGSAAWLTGCVKDILCEARLSAKDFGEFKPYFDRHTAVAFGNQLIV